MPEFTYASSFRRGLAASIDVFVANFIRAIMATILGNLWIIGEVSKFQADFKAKFDSDFIGRDPERINFLVAHSVFKSVLLFCFILFISGALYHIALNASKWRATIGKKLMKITIIKNDGAKLSFFESSQHYFLSIVPWIFVIYIFTYQLIHNTNIYKAIAENNFNLIFGFITVAWLQIHLFTKKKTTAPDMICKILVVNKP